MKFEFTELHWLEGEATLTAEQLSQLCGLSEAEIEELADLGALHLVDPEGRPRAYRASCVTAARAAGRLRTDFELPGHALALVWHLLERIGTLENELHVLRAQIPRPLR